MYCAARRLQKSLALAVVPMWSMAAAAAVRFANIAIHAVLTSADFLLI
jgi:hypothetical protein